MIARLLNFFRLVEFICTNSDFLICAGDACKSCVGQASPDRTPCASRKSALENSIHEYAENLGMRSLILACEQMFDSLGEAYDFYNLCSREHGFMIRYEKSHLNAEKRKCMLEIVCGCWRTPVTAAAAAARPFSPRQRLGISPSSISSGGATTFLFDSAAAGSSRFLMSPSPSLPPPLPAAGRLLVLYASQTGNAMDAAERVGREAERGGCPAVDVLSMDSFDPSCLPGERFVVFVVSTTGQGDPPDSMKGFWRYLLKKELGAWWLEGVRYAVFGLGDSGYQKYNFAAKKIDKRLSQLGADRIIKLGLGNDQHFSGYEGALDPWLLSLWTSLNQKNLSLLPRISDIINPSLNNLGDSKIEVVYYSSDDAPQDSIVSDIKKLIERARTMSPALKFHNDGEPQYMLKMVTNQRLTKEDSEKDVRHFELENPSSAISYQVGDALEILPSQDPSAVNAFIERCNLDPDCYIMIRAKGGDEVSKCSLVNGMMDRMKLKTFVALTMDVTSASPRRYFFEIMSYFATAEHEKERLQYFASPEGREDLYKYNQKENRTVLEVLEDFPSVHMPFEWLVQLTPPLKKRAFSISSSPLAHPNQIHLTVSVVSWLTPFKRARHGLCSTWLAGLSPNEEKLIPCWIHKGSLPPPHPSLPLVLIGPGTGCAPFRAFVEERAAQSVREPTAPVLFFFRCRNEDNDFLYKDLWLKHTEDEGVLSPKEGGGFFVAFSRDQSQKVYVQHKIKEQSARVWDLLCSGAAIYVAGSSTKMPADVTAALEEVVRQKGGEAASGWLGKLERAGKFNIETWS